MSHFVRPTVRTIPLVILAVLGLQMLAAGSAQATGTKQGQGTTVVTTIRFPLDPVDNLCNGDAVILQGDLKIRVTTTPTSNGGYTVRSTAIAKKLTGHRIAPLPEMQYSAADGEQSFTYYAPPPDLTYSFSDVHWTKLVPQGPAPTMYLVLYLKETILANGTPVTSVDGMYLTCSEPCR